MIYMLAAADDNLLIGNHTSPLGMPWHNPEDLRHFKETTLHQTIVIGANTYRMMKKALPQRQTIVISSTLSSLADAQVSSSLSGLLNAYRKSGKDLYICGGASIYKQALPYTDILLLSRIPGSHEGDTWFPAIPDMLILTKTIPFSTFSLQIYERKADALMPMQENCQ